jgi:hypothetical protein
VMGKSKGGEEYPRSEGLSKPPRALRAERDAQQNTGAMVC